MGQGSRDISRLLVMGRNTIKEYRKALIKGNLLDGDPAQLPDLEVLRAVVMQNAPPKPAPQTSSIEKWRDRIALMANKGAVPGRS